MLIVDFAFKPDRRRISVGDRVLWTDDDAVAHTTNFTDGGTRISPGSTSDRTFLTPGRFTYFCTFHPYMKGEVEVVDP